MRKISLLTGTVICLVSLVFMFSCKKKDKQLDQINTQESVITIEGQKRPNNNSPVVKRNLDKNDKSSDTSNFNEVIELFRQNKTEMSVEQFINMDWKDLNIFSNIPLLKLKEKDFAALDNVKREEIMKESLQFTSDVRKLVRSIIEKGEKSNVDHNYGLAERLFTSTLQCGEALSQPASLEVIRNLGINIQKIALKELINLYTITDNKAELQAAQKKFDSLQ